MKFNTPSLFLYAASPGSGKTWMIRWLTYNLVKEGQVDYVFVVCPTSDLNDSYDFVNSSYRHTNVTRSLLQKLIRFQSSPGARRMLLILDDCIGSLNFNWPEVNQLFTTYRHLKCTIMLTTQYIFRMPPLIRECAKYAFLFAQRTMR